MKYEANSETWMFPRFKYFTQKLKNKITKTRMTKDLWTSHVNVNTLGILCI